MSEPQQCVKNEIGKVYRHSYDCYVTTSIPKILLGIVLISSVYFLLFFFIWWLFMFHEKMNCVTDKHCDVEFMNGREKARNRERRPNRIFLSCDS